MATGKFYNWSRGAQGAGFNPKPRTDGLARAAEDPTRWHGRSNGFDARDFELEADVILPEQFYPLFRRRRDTDPNRRLAVAVFEDALKIIASRGRGRGSDRVRTETWLWIRDQSTKAYSFRWLCQVLHFDVQAVRARLIRSYSRYAQRQSEGREVKQPESPTPRRAGRHAIRRRGARFLSPPGRVLAT